MTAGKGIGEKQIEKETKESGEIKGKERDKGDEEERREEGRKSEEKRREEKGGGRKRWIEERTREKSG